MHPKDSGISLGTSVRRVHDRVLFRGDIKPLPEIGALVFDKSGKKFGKILDIIGPVNRPWVVVKLFKIDANFDQNSIYYATKKALKKRKSRQREQLQRKKMSKSKY